MYKRKTKDKYSLYGLYNDCWEWIESTESRHEIKEDLIVYIRNDPRPYKIVLTREKIVK